MLLKATINPSQDRMTGGRILGNALVHACNKRVVKRSFVYVSLYSTITRSRNANGEHGDGEQPRAEHPRARHENRENSHDENREPLFSRGSREQISLSPSSAGAHHGPGGDEGQSFITTGLVRVVLLSFWLIWPLAAAPPTGLRPAPQVLDAAQRCYALTFFSTYS